MLAPAHSAIGGACRTHLLHLTFPAACNRQVRGSEFQRRRGDTQESGGTLHNCIPYSLPQGRLEGHAGLSRKMRIDEHIMISDI